MGKVKLKKTVVLSPLDNADNLSPEKEGGIIVDMDTGKYLHVNNSAMRFIDCLGIYSVDEAVKLLANEFNTEETIVERDCKKLIHELETHNLVE